MTPTEQFKREALIVILTIIFAFLAGWLMCVEYYQSSPRRAKEFLDVAEFIKQKQDEIL